MVNVYNIKDGDVLFYVTGAKAYSGYVGNVNEFSFDFYHFSDNSRILFDKKSLEFSKNNMLLECNKKNHDALKTIFPMCNMSYYISGSNLAKYMIEAEPNKIVFLCKCSNTSDNDAIDFGILSVVYGIHDSGVFETQCNGVKGRYKYAVPVDHFLKELKMEFK